MRVLLFSPLSGRDPPSGDTSYTESLVAEPPPGVEYITYRDALDSGALRIRGRRPRSSAGSWKRADGLILLARAAEHSARGRVMFREPTWFVTIDKSAVDLVHVHLFPIRQVGSRVPVVSSYGYPLTQLYKLREQWSRPRLRLAEHLETFWARTAHVHVPWLHQVQPSVMTGYSDAAREFLIAHGASPRLTRVIGTAVPQLEYGTPSSSGRALLFVGRDYLLKGGDVAVDTFQRLRKAGHDVTLSVVTRKASAPVADHPNVTWLLDPSREDLLRNIYPSHDVLLAPTRSDCGAPYAVLEALQGGLAIVLSESHWLDARLAPPAVRRVPLEPEATAAAVADLLRGEALAEAQSAARQLWTELYSMQRLGAELSEAYRAATLMDRG